MNPFRRRAVHVEVTRSARGRKPHLASPLCWCSPAPTLTDIRSGPPVWRHMNPPNPPRRAPAVDGAPS
jgi:hypothetical protein